MDRRLDGLRQTCGNHPASPERECSVPAWLLGKFQHNYPNQPRQQETGSGFDDAHMSSPALRKKDDRNFSRMFELISFPKLPKNGSGGLG